MWLGSIASLVALALGADPTGAPGPIATRQTLFSIPFRVEKPVTPDQEPVEVQLFASGDRVATWHLYSKVEPSRQNFLFRVAGDGEYWFQVRTLDRAGRLRPEPSGAPGLRVVVDTTPPEMQLEAQRGAGGQITARWKITEPYPKPDTLTIQYRTAPTAPWQSVALSPQNSQISGTTQAGEVTWYPQPGAEQVQIRAEATDQAGNPAVSHAQVQMNQPPANTATALGPPSTGLPQSNLPPLGSTPPVDTSAPWRAAAPAANATPATNAAPVAATTPVAATAPAVPAAVQPPIANQVAPTGERPRMVNSRLFELQYDVDSVGPSGISRVELFGTRDGGRTWRTFALDDDNRSPILVRVDEEGYYGFRVVVTSGAGLGGKPPQGGDLPEVTIGVDLSKPAAQILGAEQGAGEDAGKLVINWKAEDNMLLAARPVSLLFSQTPGGPWTTLASGLENTGRYAWPVDSRMPPRIFLRLEVRDEAGNVGECETSSALSMDRMTPSVHVRNIRPLDGVVR